jgi:virulence factor Mce-like protein
MIEIRDRRSEHINRARLKLEVTRALRPTVVVVLGGIVGLGCALYIAAHVSRTLLSNTYSLRFAVADATGVVGGLDDVRIKGIPAGTITGVQMAGGRPVLTVQIQSKYGHVYRDARAQLRPNTALQDMYLDIVDRGTPSAGPADYARPLPDSQTSTSVNIDDVLGIFGANTRARLRALLDNLGNGLQDRGAALRTAFAQLAPFVRVAGSISQQLAERSPLTRELIHNTAVLTTELGSRQRQLRVLLNAGSTAVTTLQAGSGDLAATLHQLPPTMAAIDSSFAAVRRVLPDVNPAVRSLYPVAGELPGALGAVRRLSASADPAVRALQEPVGRLVPLAQTLVPLSANLNTAIKLLLPQVGTIEHTTSDVAACKTGLQGFFQWDVSMTKFGDVRGPSPRGNVVLGAQSSGVLHSPSEFAPKACTPGQPIGGLVPTPPDMH